MTGSDNPPEGRMWDSSHVASTSDGVVQCLFRRILMRQKIAVEEHFTCPDYEEYVSKAWMSPATHHAMIDRLSDIGGRRLEEMDRAGIDVAVLSLATEG